MRRLNTLLVLCLSTIAVEAQKRIVCYYGSWAVYRPGNGKFDVEDIDPNLCTHIVYGFLGLDAYNRVKFLDPWNDLGEDWGKNATGRFGDLRKRNPYLKVLIAIGGWNEGSTKYSQMAASPTTRKVFIDSVLECLEKLGYDGFDVDWEYPTQRGGAPVDKENFVLLLRELKTAFNGRYSLSAAVSAGCATVDLAYDVPRIAAELDFINLMAYDFHGAWEPRTGHNTQLYPSQYDQGDTACFNVYSALTHWYEKGAPLEKMNLGLATYGRGWLLNDKNVNGVNSPASQPIPAGPYTREAGFWGYNEICEKQLTEPWTVVRDGIVGAPFAYHENQWMGYEDPESIKQKVEFAMAWNLGGVMTWSMETDDFKGICGAETYPLIRTMKRTIENYSTYSTGSTTKPITSSMISYITTPTTSTTISYNTKPTTQAVYPVSTTKPTTTRYPTNPPTPAPEKKICTSEGYFRDPYDCTVFYQCVADGAGGYTQYTKYCPSNLVFNDDKDVCDWPANVPGCENAL